MDSHPKCQKCAADKAKFQEEVRRLEIRFSQIHSLSALERMADEVGSHYFQAGNKRFFNSRISECLYFSKAGIFFVDSTKYRNEPRRYSVKRASMNGTDMEFEGVGEFQAYSTSAKAHKVAKEEAQKAGAR